VSDIKLVECCFGRRLPRSKRLRWHGCEFRGAGLG
jgi:hypothetical protein